MRKILSFILMVVSISIISAETFKGIIKYDSKRGLPAEEVEYTGKILNASEDDLQVEKRWITRVSAELDSVKLEQMFERDRLHIQSIQDSLDMFKNIDEKLGKPFENSVQRQYVDYLASLANEKDRESITKDAAKGKISKKLGKYLYEIIPGISRRLEESRYQFDRDLATDWSYKLRLSNCPRYHEITTTYVDTIENPYYLDKMHEFNWKKDIFEKSYSNISDYRVDNYYVNKVTGSNGWDWYSESNLKEKEESYPISVRYYYDPEHPAYRFVFDPWMKNPKVYDAKGNLVRVMYPDFELYKQYFDANSDHPEFSLIARIAYAENEYDIQSADNKTTHYIKNQLGLEKLTASEQKRQDKSAKQMAKAAEGYVRDQMKYGKHSRKGRAASQKHAASFLGAMLGSGSGYYSNEGASWLSQIENDYWRFFQDKDPYKIERIDATTFKVTYADANCNPTIEIIYKYVQTKPYEAKAQVSVKKLFNGPASEYKSLPVKYSPWPLPCADRPQNNE